jgi:U3 small nucleolar RNA-associated protein 14
MRVEERRDMEGALVGVQEEDRVALDEVVDCDRPAAAVSGGWEERGRRDGSREER